MTVAAFAAFATDTMIHRSASPAHPGPGYHVALSHRRRLRLLQRRRPDWCHSAVRKAH
jgi:hypothetical protein